MKSTELFGQLGAFGDGVAQGNFVAWVCVMHTHQPHGGLGCHNFTHTLNSGVARSLKAARRAAARFERRFTPRLRNGSLNDTLKVLLWEVPQGTPQTGIFAEFY